jgi:hypothetical protein
MLLPLWHRLLYMNALCLVQTFERLLWKQAASAAHIHVVVLTWCKRLVQTFSANLLMQASAVPQIVLDTSWSSGIFRTLFEVNRHRGIMRPKKVVAFKLLLGNVHCGWHLWSSRWHVMVSMLDLLPYLCNRAPTAPQDPVICFNMKSAHSTKDSANKMEWKGQVVGKLYILQCHFPLRSTFLGCRCRLLLILSMVRKAACSDLSTCSGSYKVSISLKLGWVQFDEVTCE